MFFKTCLQQKCTEKYLKIDYSWIQTRTVRVNGVIADD